MNNLANAIGPQLLWLLAVGGAGHGYGWAGPVGVCIFAALQMYRCKDRLVNRAVIPAQPGELHHSSPLDLHRASRGKVENGLPPLAAVKHFGMRWIPDRSVAGHEEQPRIFHAALRRDLLPVAACIAIGFLCDSVFAATGLVRYASPGPWPQLAPMWIVALWAGLGLTLQHSLAFLQSRLWLAALLGAVAAPMSYYAAARAWQAIDLAQPLAMTLSILAITWALVLPLVVLIARRQQHPAPLHGQASELST